MTQEDFRKVISMVSDLLTFSKIKIESEGLKEIFEPGIEFCLSLIGHMKDNAPVELLTHKAFDENS